MGYLEKIEDPGLRDGHAGRSGWIRRNSHTSVRVAFTSIRASVELASLQPLSDSHHRLDRSVSLENT